MSIGEDGAMIVADVRGEQPPPQAGIVTHVMKARADTVLTPALMAQRDRPACPDVDRRARWRKP